MEKDVSAAKTGELAELKKIGYGGEISWEKFQACPAWRLLRGGNPKEVLMLSVEKEHPAFAESCQNLRTGQSAYSELAEIPFDLHRYRDGWHVYWKNPPNGQLGRHLKTRMQLQSFLIGNWRVGTALVSPLVEGLTFRGR